MNNGRETNSPNDYTKIFMPPAGTSDGVGHPSGRTENEGLSQRPETGTARPKPVPDNDIEEPQVFHRNPAQTIPGTVRSSRITPESARSMGDEATREIPRIAGHGNSGQPAASSQRVPAGRNTSSSVPGTQAVRRERPANPSGVRTGQNPPEAGSRNPSASRAAGSGAGNGPASSRVPPQGMTANRAAVQNGTGSTQRPHGPVRQNVRPGNPAYAGDPSNHQRTARQPGEDRENESLPLRNSTRSAHSSGVRSQSSYASVRGNEYVQGGQPSAGNVQPARYGAMVAANEAVKARPPKGRRNGKNTYDDSYEDDNDKGSGGALSSVLKAVVYIVFVLVTSGFLSYFGITVCNDVFAFVKETNEVEILIPENATIDDVKTILAENDIIKYPSIFKLYATLRKDNGIYVAGTHVVNPSMNYDMILAAIKPEKPKAEEVRITIPEGYTTDEIIDLFVSRGMGTREAFVDAIQNYDFDYWFIQDLEVKDGRKYRLDGYLYPDTYMFYTTSSPVTILSRLLDRFENIYDDEYKVRCEQLGYTVDEMITLASLIQMEAKYTAEYAAISSVFHNRLENPSYETQGYLGSDATILYALGERKKLLTADDLSIDSPYNTYNRKGLPVGPISNPSLYAIIYALYPSDSDYYYFVSQANGYNLFAKTAVEHAKNKLKAQGGIVEDYDAGTETTSAE